MMASEKEVAYGGQYSRGVVVSKIVEVVVHFIHVLLSYSPPAAVMLLLFFLVL
jgi:hypothetical protein